MWRTFSCVLPNLRIVSIFSSWCFKNNNAWWQSFENLICSICKSAICLLSSLKPEILKSYSREFNVLSRLVDGRNKSTPKWHEESKTNRVLTWRNKAADLHLHRSTDLSVENEILSYRKSKMESQKPVVTEVLVQEWEKNDVTWTLNIENKWAGRKKKR